MQETLLKIVVQTKMAEFGRRRSDLKGTLSRIYFYLHLISLVFVKHANLKTVRNIATKKLRKSF